MKLTQIGLAALVGTLAPMSAIERPKGEVRTEKDPVLPAEPQGGIVEDSALTIPKIQRAIPEAPEAAPVEKVAFLGVGGIEASEALKYQLGLRGGLLLTQVDPNSPAGLAGLEEHDIIVALNDSLLTDQESLRQVLSNYRPGDEVMLKLVRRSEDISQKLTLGEGRARLDVQGLIPGQANDLNQLLHEQMGKQLSGFDNEHLRKRLLEELERAFGPDGGKDLMELKFDLDSGNLFNGTDKRLSLQGAGSMRLQDNEGSIEMKMGSGSQELTIRDRDGETLFSGPYNTDSDKAAVPEEYRDRVERLLGSHGNGGFSLKMGDFRNLRPGKDQKGE